MFGFLLWLLLLLLCWPLALLALVLYPLVWLLLLPLVPGLGTEINGARIWISVGPFSFQPGEVAKLLLVVTFLELDSATRPALRF